MDKFIQKNTISNDANRTDQLASEDDDVIELSPLNGVTKRGKKFSTVWKYFKRSSDKKLAKCLTCAKEYKTSGNTSNLRDHLKRMHFQIIQDEESLDSPSTSISSSARSSIRSVDSYFTRAIEYDETSSRKKDIDAALAQFVVEYYQPFNIVNIDAFKNLLRVLDPRYSMPTKNTLKNVLVKNRFENIKSKLKNILNSIDYVAITTDGWTSAANEAYLTLTCHFVDSTYILRNCVLSTKKMLEATNHSAQNIANSISDVLNEWSIAEKVICIVTDNAKAMTKACEILKKPNLPCFAHSLNLTVKHGLSSDKNVDLKNLLSKCKKIVHFFKSSSIANEKLKQEQHSDQPLKLIQDVATRWNSTHSMIERIIKLNDAVSKVLLVTIKAPNPLTAEEVNTLVEVEQLLRPFLIATEQISANHVTISLIIPIVHGLHKKLNELHSVMQTSGALVLCGHLLEEFRNRFLVYETKSVARIGTILDPRFKKDAFMSYTNSEQASVLLEKEILNHMRDNSVTEVSEPEVHSSNSLFSFMNEIHTANVHSRRADGIVIKRQYLERSKSPQGTDPLMYWKTTENDFGPLKECALKYLCVPATSVDSERTFSTTGLIISNQRSRLKDKNVNMLVFLAKNKWIK